MGFGLWNQPAPAFSLEAALLVVGMAAYMRATGSRRLTALSIFGALMLVVQAVVFFGALPSSPQEAAVLARVFYALFPGVAAWLERKASAFPTADHPPCQILR